MKRKTKEILAFITMTAISVSRLHFTAMAVFPSPHDYETDDGTIESYETYDDNYATGVTNDGTVARNKGGIDENNGTVGTNEKNCEIDTNSSTGTVDTNKGKITDNEGTVNLNDSTGSIETNEGNVTINKGEITLNDSGGHVQYNFGTISTNEGDVGHLYTDDDEEENLVPDKTNSVNYGTIGTNGSDIYLNAGKEDIKNVSDSIFSSEEKVSYTGATITTNKGNITTNNGLIEENGNKENSNALIEENNGTVTSNRGYITENNGAIEISFGEITDNNEKGVIEKNIGYINDNSGTVGSSEKGSGNFNEIFENNGTVTLNAGTKDKPYGPLDSELTKFFNDYDGAVITTNNGTIIINNGHVEDNTSSGTITTNTGLLDDNNGTVTTNTGTVTNNLGVVTINTGTIGTNEKTVTQNTGTVNTNSGIVENHGTVNMNSGKVYNYGGTVKDNTNGIEYFKITIVEGSNLSRSGGNLTNYNKQEWLGQKGNDKTTTSIIITPVNGFYIPDFKVPHNVTAEKRNDGSWVLTLTSGTNLSITLPDAYAVYNGGDDTDDDSDDDSGNTVSGNVKNDSLSYDTNLQNGMNSVNQTAPVAADNLGNPVTFDYGKVIEPISMITAINSMGTQLGISVTQDNVKGCGTVNLTELFANSTADSISVPVSASVTKGQSYEVHFSNGNILKIDCTANGFLTIPFTKGQESLTYIITGAATTPPGDNSV